LRQKLAFFQQKKQVLFCLVIFLSFEEGKEKSVFLIPETFCTTGLLLISVSQPEFNGTLSLLNRL